MEPMSPARRVVISAAFVIADAFGALYIATFWSDAPILALIGYPLVFGAAAGTLTSYVFKFMDCWREDWRVALGGLAVIFIIPTIVTVVDRFGAITYWWWRYFGLLITVIVWGVACVGIRWLFIQFRWRRGQPS
jgi:hypothetical protein